MFFYSLYFTTSSLIHSSQNKKYWDKEYNNKIISCICVVTFWEYLISKQINFEIKNCEGVFQMFIRLAWMPLYFIINCMKFGLSPYFHYMRMEKKYWLIIECVSNHDDCMLLTKELPDLISRESNGSFFFLHSFF